MFVHAEINLTHQKWNTTLSELKKTLLQSITGHRVTEMIPCLNEGIQVETSQDKLSDNHIVKWQHGPWIGRSRFRKSSVARCPSTAHLTNAQGSIAMEHAQGGAAGGVAPSGHPSARQLVSPRIEGDLGGALQAGEGHRTHRDARFGQDEPRAVGPGVQQAGDYNANQAHSGRPDASDPGPHQIPGSHGDALRKVQGLALLRGPEGVQDLGGGGSVEELQRFGGPGEVRKVVKGGPDQERAEPDPNTQPGAGPGGSCDGAAAFDGAARVGQQHMEPCLTPSIEKGPSRHRHGRGAPGDAPQGRDGPIGTAFGGVETGREGEEHALSSMPIITENVEKYVYMTVDDVSTDSSAVFEGYAVVENDMTPEESDMSEGFPATKNDMVSDEIEGPDKSEVSKYNSSSDSCEMNPRKRARMGQRRRQWNNMSLGQKAKRVTTSQLHKLAEALMVMTVALGSWTKEVIADPLNDLHAVFATKHDHQPSWNSENFGRHSVDCLEIFAGHGKISGAFANKRRGVLQPRDLLLGHDLRDESQRDEVFREIYTHRPKMIWLAPPCTNWCAFSRLNHDSQERRRRRRREKELIKLVEEVIVFQRANYGLVVVENPRTSDIWRHSALSRWYHDSEMHLCQVDLCTYGLESREGIPMKKGLTLLCNSSEFAEDLTRRCDGGHEHQRIRGQETARTSVYPDEFAKAVVRAFDGWRNCAKVGVWRDDNDIIRRDTPTSFPTTSSSSSKPAEGPMAHDTPLPVGGDAISFKGKVNPTIASLIKRVHQNLGHPPNRELIRHLKIGGANEGVIRAVEQMTCKTCDSSSRPHAHKVASPVVALDFNEIVAIDILWFDTAENSNHAALNVVDLASTYQVVIPLTSTKADEVGQALCSGWFRWAGIPKQLLVDLDSAFKGDFLTMMDERSVMVRSAAAQAHWQNGVAERHGETWKLIWAKLVEDHLVVDTEIEEAVAAVCDSKNSLRNRSGYSPRQWVFGVNQRLPGDLFDGSHELSSLDAASAQGKFGRLQTIKNGAKAAFFQVQTKEAYQRAVNHKTRVKPEELQVGDLAYLYREMKQGKAKKPSASWTGPATVIGREGQNFWLARGGRCYLAAPEHLRPASPEEVSETLRLKMAMKEVKKLIEQDVSEDETAIDESYVPADEEPDVSMEAVPAQDGGRPNPRTPAQEAAASRELAIRQAAKRTHLLDDVPMARQQEGQQAFMMKRCISKKGKEKQLEKELPWGLIHPDERPLYREAEAKQWAEHVEYGAVRPLSAEESRHVLETVPNERILNSRFAYRDKNYAKRKSDPQIPPKPKARLCIAGQWDPDLGVKDLATDALTVGRQSVILALQLALARAWVASVGDIRAAFLNGIPAPRKLYFRQPRNGIPSLQPEQLVEVLKGVFGLSTKPETLVDQTIK